MTEKEKSENPESPAKPVQLNEDTARPSEKGQDDLAWRVAQLASSLLSREAPARSRARNEWVWAEDYFTDRVDEAIRKARVIIERASEQSSGEIRLHEYFQPGVDLNANQIRDILDDVGWWSTSRPTLDTRLKAIREQWEAQLKQLKDGYFELQDLGHKALLGLEQMLQGFCDREGVIDSLPKAQELCRNLISELHRGLLFSDQEKQTIEFYRHQQLYDWCFHLESNSESASTSTKRYRFHELLRVADDHGWLPEEFTRPTGPLSAAKQAVPPFFAISKIGSFSAFNEYGVKSPLTSYP